MSIKEALQLIQERMSIQKKTSKRLDRYFKKYKQGPEIHIPSKFLPINKRIFFKNLALRVLNWGPKN